MNNTDYARDLLLHLRDVMLIRLASLMIVEVCHGMNMYTHSCQARQLVTATSTRHFDNWHNIENRCSVDPERAEAHMWWYEGQDIISK